MPNLNNKKPHNYSEIFFTSLINDLNNSPELVSETLKENNIDEKEIENNTKQLTGKLIAQIRIKAAKESKQNVFQKALSLLKNTNINLSDLNPREKLFNILSSGQQTPSFTFSNLQNVSNEDILEMLSDIQIIDLIEDLEKRNTEL